MVNYLVSLLVPTAHAAFSTSTVQTLSDSAVDTFVSFISIAFTVMLPLIVGFGIIYSVWRIVKHYSHRLGR